MQTPTLLLLLALAAPSLAAPSLAAPSIIGPTPHGVLVTVAGRFQVEMAVEGLSSFRISVLNGTAAPVQLTTGDMVGKKTAYATFTVSQSGSDVKLTSTSPSLPGSVTINTDSGAFVLADAHGTVLTTSPALVSVVAPKAAAPALRGNNTCANPHLNTDAFNPQRSPAYPNGLRAATQAACCAACDADSSCTTWVYATDAENPNCWPLSNLGGVNSNAGNRVLGGYTPPPPPPPPATMRFSLTTTAGAQIMGSGTDGGNAETLPRTSVQALTENMGSWTPSFWCSDGWSMLAVSPFVDLGAAARNKFPVSWASSAGKVNIDIVGGSGGSPNVDLYLTPAADLRAHVAGQSALEGFPAMLPRYALGFMACRWGWTDQKYIEGVIAEFRSGVFPADLIISDFEWYTPEPDYNLPPQGNKSYRDFSYNNITWPPPQAPLIARYRSQYNMRFGGIRKPRLGNSDLLVMAQGKGWLMGQLGDPNGKPDGSRNTNFSIAEFSAWYSVQQAPYDADGVLLFWLDEGEDDYFVFQMWSAAQIVTLRASAQPNRRFLSINRAFSPGASRLGVVVWTGDISPAWTDLQRTPGYVLNWGLAGAHYVTCDIGGFNAQSNALLLTRWYGLGVFMPVMRVHSTIGTTPHFPFPSLWGNEASAAMRVHLNTRYALLPLLYSLMYEAHATGVPSMRPMRMVFPNDATSAGMTAQFMVGNDLLVAPVLAQNNATSAYLPAGTWFGFNSSKTYMGPTTLNLPSVPLDAVPAFVRSGAIITLAPPIQYTDALPGGPLAVQVYTGASSNGTVYYDDDGETTDYDGATGAYALVTFAWDDGAGCLSWSRVANGGYAGGPRSFTQLTVTAFSASKPTATSPPMAIGQSGKACPT